MSDNPLIPATSSFFKDKVVSVEPAEMEPFYERDSIIRQHREIIQRLKLAKAEYDAQQDATTKELEVIITDSLRIIGLMRQKVKAAKARIATATDRKKNAAHNFAITKHYRAIEQRKTQINRRELGKTARVMATHLFRKMKTRPSHNMDRKLTKPNIPEE